MRACLVSSYPPMHCGIATFTRDLRSGLYEAEPSASVSVLAVGEVLPGQRFSREVVLRIDKQDSAAYRRAGQALNRAGFDVVCVQHEFGIFGGPEGRAIVDLLEEVRCPTVVTLHTVERDFAPHYRRALMEVVAASDHLVAPSESGKSLLVDVYGVDERRVTVIHHGVPDAPFTPTEPSKRALGFSDRLVLLTFGLLSSNKGIENVLDALPEVVDEHPDLLYVVLGATHPEVKRRHGEEYRESLLARVEDLGLSKHVEFHDRYVDQPELVEYLSACDIYVTPYHARQQIVSGTLAYAVGMGKAVISTPYPYARELLADGRGIVVGYDDAPGIAKALRRWLDDPDERERVRRGAYAFGRQMTWAEVGRRYTELFEVLSVQERRAPVDTVPRADLTHLARLTDDTGTLQHALFDIPNRRYGYTTDDVARALIVGVRSRDPEALRLVTTSLAFLAHAQREDGRFRNEMAYDRTFLDDVGSEDTLGQSLWGLGIAAADGGQEGVRSLAWRLFVGALPNVTGLSHPRALAYAVCGLAAALRARPGDRGVRAALATATGALTGLYDRSRAGDWHWFGFDLTYANAKLPQALLLAAQVNGDARLAAVGLETLDFLLQQTVVDGRFEFVGNEGWHERGGPRAEFGQQPIEAAYTAEACLTAAEVCGDDPARADRYRGLARTALAWFTGRNRLGVTLYDPETGTCQDGIDRTGVSANAGAESTIVCLLALLAAEEAGLTDA